MRLRILTLVSMLSLPLSAARYALLLQDEPIAAPRSELQSVNGRRLTIEAEQTALKSSLAARKIAVTGAVQTLLNAGFIEAEPDRADALRLLPNVKAVVKLGVRRPHLARAAALIHAPAAWAASRMPVWA